jgi:cysteinyl-tRNA synthetase
MAIHLFNTLSAKKELFQTLTPQRVKMYCCGVTPYSNTHIGHSRTFFSYDLLFRTLEDHGYEIDWARNITDVDDKIILKAQSENVTCSEIVNRYVSEQDELLNLFNLYKPKHEPKVTESIPQIIALIEKLIQNEFAYVTSSGVYYRVQKYAEYGKLSKNNIKELRSGARIDIDEEKEDPIDFVLWKFAKPGEIKWNSPWGEGRPGWHIECSAMIHSLFGDSIDIHMGGRDLIFPHHEAEIAQSEGATGKPFSRYWLHTGMVTLYGEKMSKSANHYVSAGDFLSRFPAEVLRLVFLSVSYSQPLDYTIELAQENLKKLARIYRFVSLVNGYQLQASKQNTGNEYPQHVFEGLDTLVSKMRVTIADDLGTGAALALFFDFIRNVNAHLGTMEKKGFVLNTADRSMLNAHWNTTKKWFQNSLGLLLCEPDAFFASLAAFKLSGEFSAQDIDKKLQERTAARDAKNWAEADKIRDVLLAQGVQIQDSPTGTKWTVQL